MIIIYEKAWWQVIEDLNTCVGTDKSKMLRAFILNIVTIKAEDQLAAAIEHILQNLRTKV